MAYALVILIIGAAKRWDKIRGALWKSEEGRLRREMTTLI